VAETQEPAMAETQETATAKTQKPAADIEIELQELETQTSFVFEVAETQTATHPADETQEPATDIAVESTGNGDPRRLQHNIPWLKHKNRPPILEAKEVERKHLHQLIWLKTHPLRG
jgi:hypothetical protein